MKIAITGGLGFLGSNLATRLSHEGHDIRILDNLDPLYGGNEFNLHDAVTERIEVYRGDIRDQAAIERLIDGVDAIYHFAAQVSYIDGLNMPFVDLDSNARSTLTILETLRHTHSKARLVFASSRMVYGRTYSNPVTEEHPTKPISLYGVHKLNSERYMDIYYSNYHIPCTALRITNPYGVKQQMKHSKYSILGWFVRQAMENHTIRIFGDGDQKRDYIFADDIVSAFVAVLQTDRTVGEMYNLGTGHSIKFREMVETIIEVVGSGSIERVPWPKSYENIETGDFEVSIHKLQKDTGWKPSIEIREGIRRTYEYYAKHHANYF